jgi:hypothetical protein
MSDERIEPSISHEYIVEVATEVDAETRERMLVLRVTTTREFTSFAYDISLQLTVSESEKQLHLEIGGLSIPSVMMPSTGGAVSERKVNLLPAGTYQLIVAKKSRTLETSLTIAKDGTVSAKAAANAFAAIRI